MIGYVNIAFSAEWYNFHVIAESRLRLLIPNEDVAFFKV